MPKQKITREMVIEAAFSLAKAGGMEQVLVKNIAEKLGCSVQPIYSYCSNMESLRQEVIGCASEYVRKFVAERVDPDDMFRSTGRAYVQVAREEPQLFKLFILHRRAGVSSLEELYAAETNPQMAEIIAKQLRIRVEAAKQLHLHMLIYTIGIGTIFSVTDPGIPAEEIFYQQELACGAFLKQVREETL